MIREFKKKELNVKQISCCYNIMNIVQRGTTRAG